MILLNRWTKEGKALSTGSRTSFHPRPTVSRAKSEMDWNSHHLHSPEMRPSLQLSQMSVLLLVYFSVQLTQITKAPTVWEAKNADNTAIKIAVLRPALSRTVATSPMWLLGIWNMAGVPWWLSQLRIQPLSLLWHRFQPWPRNFHVPWVWLEKKMWLVLWRKFSFDVILMKQVKVIGKLFSMFETS